MTFDGNCWKVVIKIYTNKLKETDGLFEYIEEKDGIEDFLYQKYTEKLDDYDMYDIEEIMHYDKSFEINGITVYKHRVRGTYSPADEYYAELPFRIYDYKERKKQGKRKRYIEDKIEWKKDRKTGVYKTTLSTNSIFRYDVSFNGKDAVISVVYCACENLHRNNVTLSVVNVENATNLSIIDAIKHWREQMSSDLLGSIMYDRKLHRR